MYYRIKQLRDEKGWNQTQVAKMLNCSQQVFSNYELGQRDIPTSILIKMADVFETTTDYILSRTNKK